MKGGIELKRSKLDGEDQDELYQLKAEVLGEKGERSYGKESNR
jgi:hypothetical protein